MCHFERFVEYDPARQDELSAEIADVSRWDEQDQTEVFMLEPGVSGVGDGNSP